MLDNIKEYLGSDAERYRRWIQAGDIITVKDHIVKGIETFPQTLMMLFNGENFGNLISQ